ncbi:MAG: TonB-dependent receptor [Candidatus Adiutrix sp.]|nr:TonB-dependent receptor [Candidatus Adiutrix sp.]
MERKFKHYLLGLATLALTAGLATPALAQSSGGGGKAKAATTQSQSLPGQENLGDGKAVVQLSAAELVETKTTMAVITQEDMQRKNADNLFEALRSEPGILMDGNTGGFRGSSYISIRGFDYTRIGMSLDGIPLANGWGREFDMARIATFDIKSIEVSKGYSSPLIGTNTNMGGVIDIRTGKPEKELEFKALYKNQFDREFDDMGREYGVSIGTRQDKFYLKTTYYAKDQDFFTPSEKALPAPGDKKGGRRGRSDSEDWQLNIIAGWTPTEDVDIMVGYLRHEAEKNSNLSYSSPGSPDARTYSWPDWDTERIYLTADVNINEQSYFKGTVYYDEHRDTLLAWLANGTLDQSFSSKFDDSGWGSHLEYGYTFNDQHKLAVAANYRADEHERWTPDDNIRVERAEGNNYDLGAEYTYKPLDPLSFVFGLNYAVKEGEKYIRQGVTAAGSKSGPEFTAPNKPKYDALNWQFGTFYNLTPEHEVHFTYARKTNFPSWESMYGSVRLITGADPNSARRGADIDPEIADHFEIGYKGDIDGWLELSANVFYSKVSDVIGSRELCASNPNWASLGCYNANDPNSVSQVNIGKANFSGYELGLTAVANEYITLGSNLSYLKTHRKSNENSTNNMVYDKPKFMANAYLIITPLEDWRIIPSLQAVDSRKNLAGDKVLPGFARVDLKTTYDLTENIALQAGIENIGDINYGYSSNTANSGFITRDVQPGRNYYLGMSYTY